VFEKSSLRVGGSIELMGHGSGGEGSLELGGVFFMGNR